MVRAGVIRRYAVGGAMAAILYGEPAAMCDLDVRVHVAFVMQEAKISRPLLSEILERQVCWRSGAASEMST